uniref:C2H2-type domain-containing protein n=1 Tax=Monopterus albus TaxID=43700 RepID=A0A3Q3IYK2_MONAL
HPCSICPKSFLKPCLLRKHMRTHIRDGLLTQAAAHSFQQTAVAMVRANTAVQCAAVTASKRQLCRNTCGSTRVNALSSVPPAGRASPNRSPTPAPTVARASPSPDQRLHTDARPYQCGICQKTFKQQSSLKTHQLTHSGVRFRCPLCSKSFSRALELTYHVDTHSDAQPYFCSICKKNLSGARIFRNHMKKHETANSPLPRTVVQSENRSDVQSASQSQSPKLQHSASPLQLTIASSM